MTSLIENIMGAADLKINDQIIVNDSLQGLKGMAAAYLGATLESATPEVRRMWAEYMNQSVAAHDALTALAIKKKWYKPYLSPAEQLSVSYDQSQWSLSPES